MSLSLFLSIEKLGQLYGHCSFKARSSNVNIHNLNSMHLSLTKNK